MEGSKIKNSIIMKKAIKKPAKKPAKKSAQPIVNPQIEYKWMNVKAQWTYTPPEHRKVDVHKLRMIEAFISGYLSLDRGNGVINRSHLSVLTEAINKLEAINDVAEK